MKKEFLASFQISRTVIFNVNYYTLSTNKSAYFATSADEFNRLKTDYERSGQAQNDLLPCGKARKFFKKWDEKHLHDLTEEEYQEMKKDLAELMEAYNYIYKELDETQKPYNPHISFYNVKRLSMEKLPNSRNAAHEFVA